MCEIIITEKEPLGNKIKEKYFHNSKFIFTYLFGAYVRFCVCMCLCVCVFFSLAHAKACMWMSEMNPQGLVLSFHPVGPEGCS